MGVSVSWVSHPSVTAIDVIVDVVAVMSAIVIAFVTSCCHNVTTFRRISFAMKVVHTSTIVGCLCVYGYRLDVRNRRILYTMHPIGFVLCMCKHVYIIWWSFAVFESSTEILQCITSWKWWTHANICTYT